MILKNICFTVVILAVFFANSLKASDVNNGREIYHKHCAICHGQNGQSLMAGAPDFNRGQGLFKSDYSLLERIQSGANACPAYRGILTEQKIFDVIAFIITLN